MKWTGRHYAALLLVALAGAAAWLFVPGKQESDTAFMGHYGYAFRLSPTTTEAYKITAAFRDEKRTSEVVFVHPKDMDADEVFRTPESQYAARGIVRMEINPNSLYPAASQDKLVEAFRYAAKKTLEDRGEKYRFLDLEEAPLPGFGIEIDRPERPVTQIFLKGGEVHYLLTSAGDNRALHEMLSSLVDTVKTKSVAGEPG